MASEAPPRKWAESASAPNPYELLVQQVDELFERMRPNANGGAKYYDPADAARLSRRRDVLIKADPSEKQERAAKLCGALLSIVPGCSADAPFAIPVSFLKLSRTAAELAHPGFAEFGALQAEVQAYTLRRSDMELSVLDAYRDLLYRAPMGQSSGELKSFADRLGSDEGPHVSMYALSAATGFLIKALKKITPPETERIAELKEWQGVMDAFHQAEMGSQAAGEAPAKPMSLRRRVAKDPETLHQALEPLCDVLALRCDITSANPEKNERIHRILNDGLRAIGTNDVAQMAAAGAKMLMMEKWLRQKHIRPKDGDEQAMGEALELIDNLKRALTPRRPEQMIQLS